MRPHEETWVLGTVTVQFPTRRGAHTSGIILGGVPKKSDRDAVLRLIAAAPKMARALLLIRAALEQISNDDMTEELAEAQGEIGQVLTKAGVLP